MGDDENDIVELGGLNLVMRMSVLVRSMPRR